MKLYILKNYRTESDFRQLKNSDFSGDHSSCIVILAENADEAREMLVKKETSYFGELIELGLDTKGIVVYADGRC